MPHFHYFMNGNGDVYCMLSTWRASPISFHVILQQRYEVGDIILESKMLHEFTVPPNSWVAEHRCEPRPMTWENAVLTASHPARVLWDSVSLLRLWRVQRWQEASGGPRFSYELPRLDSLPGLVLASLAGSTLSSVASPFPVSSLLHACVGQ